MYFADFETTQFNPNEENPCVGVYLWAIVSGSYEKHGFTIESFIELIKTMSGTIYFHNLKFDFSYIHYYCLEHNIDVKILEKGGQLYQVKLFDVDLRDSMNFLPMTLKEIGENYNEKYQKTSIDYNVNNGHKATQQEIDYCINDCRVLEEGFNKYIETLCDVLKEAGCFKTVKKVNKKLTNAGIAFECFKELSNFSNCCPKTTQNEYNLFSSAYKGGYVYSNPKGIVTNVQMIDVNSLYPFIYSTIDMPIGKPITCKSEQELNKFKFGILKVLIKYELKQGYIPIIGGGIGKFGNTLYKSSSSGEFEEQTFCTTDFNLIKRFYDIEYEFVWGFGFECCPKFFERFAQTFIEFKNRYKGVKRAVAKILLNSPYGKTAMNGFQEIYSYNIKEKDKSIEKTVVGYEIDENAYQYLPMAIAITAGARQKLLSTAEEIGFENIYYMDTDSIKYQNKPVDFEFDDNILGMWKDEGLVDLFKTISPKKYVYWSSKDNVIKYTCAGFNKKTLEEQMYHGKVVSKNKAKQLMRKFSEGLTLECLQSKLVKGGRALILVKKEIK